MKIEYKPAGAGSYAVLANEDVAELGARISSFQVGLSKSPFTINGYGAPASLPVDLGNASWRLSFVVERLHVSADAALEYLAAHPAAFATQGNLDLKISVGSKTTYMLNCVTSEFAPNPHSDLSTICRYTFVGGSYTN